MEQKRPKTPSLKCSVCLLTLLLLWIVVAMLWFKLDVRIALFFAIVAIALVSYFWFGNSAAKIIDDMAASVSGAMSGLFIFFLIGMAIAIWMISGCLPAVVYYGLKLMNPIIFLPATFILSSIFSLCTGTAWTTAGTIGLVCFGIGISLGIPEAMTVGAVVSGAYFGDKMSPVSDSTNMAPLSSGTDVFSHIRAMLYVTGPAYVIAFILYLVLGFSVGGGSGDIHEVMELEQAITGSFNVNIIVLLPLVVVVVLSLMRKPAIPILVAGVLCAIPIAIFVQGQDWVVTLNAMVSGVSLDIENTIVSSIVNRGGIYSMMETLSLVIISLAFGGLMAGCGVFHVIIRKMVEHVRSPRLYPMITVITAALLVVATGGNYVPLTLVGPLFGEAYDDVGLDRSMLSRNIEEGATITAVMCPWASSAAYYVGVFGIPTMAYFPYSFLNIITIILACVLPLCGLTLVTKEKVARKNKKAQAGA